VQIVNAANVIYNAPIVAFGVDASQINFPNGGIYCSKAHDEIMATDLHNMTVTLNLINGFSFGRPVWYLSMDANLYEWTQDAINNGFRGQLREEFQILTFVQDKLLTGLGGKPFGSAGFSINCPPFCGLIDSLLADSGHARRFSR
jgi:hypothetical protein